MWITVPIDDFDLSGVRFFGISFFNLSDDIVCLLRVRWFESKYTRPEFFKYYVHINRYSSSVTIKS